MEDSQGSAYLVGTRWNRISEAIPVSSHKTFFLYIVTKNYCKYGKCPKNSNTKASDKMTYANRLKEQSDQGLHCLPFH